MADRTGTLYGIADEAVHGLGGQFLVGDEGSPETFQAVAGVRNIASSEASTEDIDVTHLRSEGAHREHMPGLRDHGPFTITGIYLPNDESHSTAGGGSGSFTSGGLPTIWKNREFRNFKVELNDPASPNFDWTFRGYIASFAIGDVNVDGVVEFTCTVQPSEDFDTP